MIVSEYAPQFQDGMTVNTETKTPLGKLMEEAEKEKPHTKKIEYNKNAPTNDCVAFVEKQRKKPGGGIFDNDSGGVYSGEYIGKSGKLPAGESYGQEPQVGAIMVESPSDTNGIHYGHVSYVVEVAYDQSGQVTSYKIVEGNYPTGKFHEETFNWNEGKKAFVNDKQTRAPDMFIY
jgi:surface antigen